VTSQRDRRLHRQRVERRPQPALERDRVQPVRERAQLRARLGDVLARDPQQPPRLRRVHAVELAAGDVEELAERDQPLLGAVVEVAPDPLALLVGRLEHLGARGDQRALALAPRSRLSCLRRSSSAPMRAAKICSAASSSGRAASASCVVHRDGSRSAARRRAGR
jgi:hypothetical protein